MTRRRFSNLTRTFIFSSIIVAKEIRQQSVSGNQVFVTRFRVKSTLNKDSILVGMLFFLLLFYLANALRRNTRSQFCVACVRNRRILANFCQFFSLSFSLLRSFQTFPIHSCFPVYIPSTFPNKHRKTHLSWN